MGKPTRTITDEERELIRATQRQVGLANSALLDFIQRLAFEISKGREINLQALLEIEAACVEDLDPEEDSTARKLFQAQVNRAIAQGLEGIDPSKRVLPH